MKSPTMPTIRLLSIATLCWYLASPPAHCATEPPAAAPNTGATETGAPEASSAEADATREPDGAAANPDAANPDAATPDAATQSTAGQSDLDEALRLRVTAQSMADLERIIELGESALQKGLDDDTSAFAKQIVAASLFQHASRLSQDLLQGDSSGAAAAHLRRFALTDLRKATRFDDSMGELYLLIAKLEAIDGGDLEQAREAANKAVDRFQGPDQRMELSNALATRATLIEDAEQGLADLTRALELNSQNMQALRARGMLYAKQEKIEEALKDFQALIELDSDNLLALQDVASLLEQQKDHEQALKYVNRALEIDPNSPGTHLLRAQIRMSQNQVDLALQDLDHVIRVVPRDGKANFLLMKAKVCLQQNGPEVPPEAKQKYDRQAVHDLTELLRLQPGSEQGLILRAIAYASMQRFGPAVNDLQALVQLNPEPIEYHLQLAAYLVQDKRPRSAIEVYDGLLGKDSALDRARLGRADALLSIGEHAQAIAEYERVLANGSEEIVDSVLNNLAWVLATSPNDALRDGKRSVELALRACELTEYKQAHILSTLAAGYAEMNDFDQARHWSEKAVELGKDHRDATQLTAELDKYRQNQPWRESELVQERTADAPPQDASLDSLDNDTPDNQGLDLLPTESPGSETPANTGASASDESQSDEKDADEKDADATPNDSDESDGDSQE